MQTKIWTSSLQTMGFVIHEQPSGEWCACFCSIWSQLVIIITWNLNELPYKIIYHSDWWCDIGRPSNFLSNSIMYPFSMKCEIKGRCLLPLRRPWRDEESPWINTVCETFSLKIKESNNLIWNILQSEGQRISPKCRWPNVHNWLCLNPNSKLPQVSRLLERKYDTYERK